MSFEAFPKIPRFSRGCTITEKIDGTNAQVHIIPGAGIEVTDPLVGFAVAADKERGLLMLAGSRSRYITPDRDNFGFAAWVKANAEMLWGLGEGRHFGEWWGSGVQRGYGLEKGEKRFSLFNTRRWILSEADRIEQPEKHDNRQRVLPACCHVVPVLYEGAFGDAPVELALAALALTGSVAAPGFMNPEGIVVFHHASGTSFKKTVEKDEEPKGQH